MRKFGKPEDPNPSLARLRSIREIVEMLQIDPEISDYDRRYKVVEMLREAERVAARKAHLVRKLRAQLRAKERRIAKLAGHVRT